ncbi:hypothetical protein EVAR_83474_1 [Eumeta japonica]|uniref:Uncharacterized protein n=1 Tax=Eumeta variegata TaxID=151549 RepID=A0A4C1ZK23_EUMVA|nr:hypothetical protein EVAR_83474_1 [Eumeta japonica]
MDSHRLKQFLAERGLLDLLKDFEAYCSSPASPEQPNPDLEMEVELNTNKEPTKRPAAARPSEGSTSSSSDSDAGESDDSDLSEFTTVRRRKASRPKTATSYLTEAGDGSTYYRITPSSKKPKTANPKTKPTIPGKSTKSIYDAQRAGKTVQPTRQRPHGHTPRGGRNRPRPANPNQGIVILNGRNSIKGLKIQPESVTDFRNLSSLLATLKVAYHTPKGEREFRVVLRGVPKSPPKRSEDLLTQDLLYNRCDGSLTAPEPLDLVLVTANTGIDQETKRSFYRIKAVCSLSGVKVEQPS